MVMGGDNNVVVSAVWLGSAAAAAAAKAAAVTKGAGRKTGGGGGGGRLFLVGVGATGVVASGASRLLVVSPSTGEGGRGAMGTRLRPPAKGGMLTMGTWGDVMGI